MNDLSPQARELLRAARAEALPAAADRARSLATLKAVLPAAPAAAAVAGLAFKAKLLIGAVTLILTAGGAATVYYARSSPAAPAPAPVHEPPKQEELAAQTSASAEPSSAPEAAAAPTEAPPAVAPSVPRAAPLPTATASARDDMGDDLALMARARQALASHQAAAALGLLDEHAAKFPRSAFGEERAYTRIRALCELGRSVEARGAGERFLRARPSSMYAAGVRRSCAGSSTNRDYR
jgi:dihydroneopterin aldolase/2-amino-4-hydroxy-6-hydroxymethyldihydropteridine diphosphokinase